MTLKLCSPEVSLHINPGIPYGVKLTPIEWNNNLNRYTSWALTISQEGNKIQIFGAEGIFRQISDVLFSKLNEALKNTGDGIDKIIVEGYIFDRENNE